MKSILITGGTGFLGSHLIERLCDKFKITLIVRKSSDLKKIKCKSADVIMIEKISDIEMKINHDEYDILIHAACNYGKKNIVYDEMFYVNVSMPLKLVEVFSKSKKNLIINIDTILNHNISLYSLTKHYFRNLCNNLYENDIKIFHARFDMIYGIGDKNPKLIPKIIEKIKKGLDIKLSPGNQMRDFLYIDDAVDSIIFLINNFKRFDKNTICIGSGKLNSLKKILIYLEKNISDGKVSRLKFGALNYRKNEIFKTNLDCSYINNLGWKSKINYKEGINKIVKNLNDKNKH